MIVAHMADQSFWGSELRRLGVAGKTLQRKSLTAQKLAKEIAFVINDPTMPKKAAIIGQAMAEEDGVKKAIQLVEKIFM